jgi:hypothetical protein
VCRWHRGSTLQSLDIREGEAAPLSVQFWDISTNRKDALSHTKIRFFMGADST